MTFKIGKVYCYYKHSIYCTSNFPVICALFVSWGDKQRGKETFISTNKTGPSDKMAESDLKPKEIKSHSLEVKIQFTFFLVQ